VFIPPLRQKVLMMWLVGVVATGKMVAEGPFGFKRNYHRCATNTLRWLRPQASPSRSVDLQGVNKFSGAGCTGEFSRLSLTLSHCDGSCTFQYYS